VTGRHTRNQGVVLNVERGMRSHLAVLIAGLAVPALLATGCGSDEVDPAASVPPTAPTVPVASTVPDTEPPAAGVEIVTIVTDVDYYGACGNETVVVEGTTWYPLLQDELEALDEGRYPLEVADPGQSGLMRVVPPGPGDDVGTLIVYTDGIARFQSESGRIVWLTNEERTYNWVC
jgi:hypothetical protein